MEYITTKDASIKWGISTTRITILANEGRIPGAERLGKSWLIPANATKPTELKANHSRSKKKEPFAGTVDFSFPLYHFRPDWSSTKESHLSNQQKQLLLAENAIMECRFTDAYPMLQPILDNPEDIVTEIGCIWCIGICCVGLNKPNEFIKIYHKLQMLLSEDFPNRDDLAIILDNLKSYVDTLESFANNNSCNTDIHEQCLPLLCLQRGYSIMTHEIMYPGTADTRLLELNLRLLQSTSSIVVTQIMHLFLLGIYFLRQDVAKAKMHGKLAIEIAFENGLFFPLATYYASFNLILAPILAEYPENFQKHCHKIINQYEKNFNSFLASISEHSVISKLAEADYPYIYAVMLNMSNSVIADRMGISQRTVKRKIDVICDKLGVTNKKELKDYIHNYM